MILLILAVLSLAFANGANDNFKGAATLLGTGSMDYRRALAWATASTLAGSALAFVLARELVRAFTGAGLVPDAVTADPAFLTAVSAGAAGTVLLATRLGLPVSTTHALVGALAGAGLAAVGSAGVNLGRLATKFLLPLLASPLAAFLLVGAAYPLLRRARLGLGVERETCVCVGTEFVPVSALPAGAGLAAEPVAIPTIGFGRNGCVERYRGDVLGLSAQALLDGLHTFSACAISFARGVNDTPKIAALLLGAALLGGTRAGLLVGMAIAFGGILGARRVAETMSHRITEMNAGQGATANFATAFLVIFASRWGLPVSTTHVSCGSLFAIGARTGAARWRIIAGIVAAWVTTLPLGAALGAGVYCALGR